MEGVPFYIYSPKYAHEKLLEGGKNISNDSQNEDLESVFNKDSCRCSNS